MEILRNLIKKPSLPYILLFILCAMQFWFIAQNNASEQPDNFWLIVAIVLGSLGIQIWRNNKIFRALFSTLLVCLIAYLILAFLSDLVKAETFGWKFFEFLIGGILFFSFLIFIEIRLFKGKPERLF